MRGEIHLFLGDVQSWYLMFWVKAGQVLMNCVAFLWTFPFCPCSVIIHEFLVRWKGCICTFFTLLLLSSWSSCHPSHGLHWCSMKYLACEMEGLQFLYCDSPHICWQVCVRHLLCAWSWAECSALSWPCWQMEALRGKLWQSRMVESWSSLANSPFWLSASRCHVVSTIRVWWNRTHIQSTHIQVTLTLF